MEDKELETIEEPVVEEPVVEEPVVEEPVVEEPKKKKTTKKTVVEAPVEEEPVVEEIASSNPTQASSDLTIGEAMEALKQGRAVARRAWADKHIKRHWHHSFDCNPNLKEGVIVDEAGSNYLLPHVDLLSNDWYIVE